MFFVNLDELVLRGITRAHKSNAELVIEKCERINWFLYRSEYLTGDRQWSDASPKVKRDILDGLIEHVFTTGEDEGSMMSLTTMPYIRRVGLMK